MKERRAVLANMVMLDTVSCGRVLPAKSTRCSLDLRNFGALLLAGALGLRRCSRVSVKIA